MCIYIGNGGILLQIPYILKYPVLPYKVLKKSSEGNPPTIECMAKLLQE
jgi:hypothetical protein